MHGSEVDFWEFKGLTTTLLTFAKTPLSLPTMEGPCCIWKSLMQRSASWLISKRCSSLCFQLSVSSGRWLAKNWCQSSQTRSVYVCNEVDERLYWTLHMWCAYYWFVFRFLILLHLFREYWWLLCPLFDNLDVFDLRVSGIIAWWLDLRHCNHFVSTQWFEVVYFVSASFHRAVWGL